MFQAPNPWQDCVSCIPLEFVPFFSQDNVTKRGTESQLFSSLKWIVDNPDSFIMISAKHPMAPV